MRIDEKLKLARQLAALGVDIIEAGFPDRVRGRRRSGADDRHARRAGRSSPRWRAATRPTSIAPPGRSRRRARRRIHIFIATSDLHLERKLRMSREALPDRGDRRGPPRAQVSPTTCSFPPRTRRAATRTSSAGSSKRSSQPAPRRSTCPTPSATRRPTRSQTFFRPIDQRACRTPTTRSFSAHCHDDLGLAVANTLAALTAGARQVECTINGIGERAGNASLEEIVMATRVRADRLPFTTGIDTQQIFAAEPAADRAHRRGRPGQQGDRRPQRVRARGRHPPGRHAEGSPHLRDHAARGRRRAAGDAGARQALRPPRRAAPLRAARPHARAPGARRVYRAVIALADREKIVNDADLATIVASVRGRRRGRPPASRRRSDFAARRRKSATGTASDVRRRDARRATC